MADIGVIGGGENTLIFRAKSDFSGVVQADGTTAATTNAHALVAITTSITKADFKVDKHTLTVLKHDDALYDFVDEYASFASSAEQGDDVQYGEKGTKWSTASGGSDNIPVVIVSVGGTNSEGVQVTAACGYLDEDALNISRESKKWQQKVLNFTAWKAVSAITIANGLIPTGIVDSGETLTIPIGRPLKTAFLDPA